MADTALARLAALADRPEGLIEARAGQFGQVAIAREGADIVMVFFPLGVALNNDALSGVMARVDPAQPFLLKSAYLQAMLAGCLAFAPTPGAAYVMGAGGGRLPLVLRHVVQVEDVRGAELDGAVLALSQAWLGFDNGPGLQIDEGDGRAHLAGQGAGAFDHLYLDCFSVDGRVPPALSTVEHFALCRSRLRPGGVMAVNLLQKDPLFAAQKAGFCQVFGSVWEWEQGGSVVLIGTDGAQRPGTVPEAAALGFDPAPYVRNLRPVPAVLQGASQGAEPLREAALFDPQMAALYFPPGTFDGLRRNAPCPCGSGRKVKQCHGRR